MQKIVRVAKPNMEDLFVKLVQMRESFVERREAARKAAIEEVDKAFEAEGKSIEVCLFEVTYETMDEVPDEDNGLTTEGAQEPEVGYTEQN